MKKVLSAFLTLTLLLLTLSLSSCSSEKTDLEYIKDKGEMIIGITYFKPMNYFENDELVGFETEFAKAVCAELGVTPKFQEIDWNAKETELNAKNIDCIWNGMTITDERKEAMDISIPYMNNKQVMVVKKGNENKYTTPESLKDAKVVAEAKSAGADVAKTDEFFKLASYTDVDSQAKVLLEVKSGVADIGIIDYVMTIGSIGENTDYSDLVIVEGKSFADEQYGIAFRKNSPETLKAVNEAIEKLRKNGTLLKIAEKYNLQDVLIKN
mgnify:FL=1